MSNPTPTYGNRYPHFPEQSYSGQAGAEALRKKNQDMPNSNAGVEQVAGYQVKPIANNDEYGLKDYLNNPGDYDLRPPKGRVFKDAETPKRNYEDEKGLRRHPYASQASQREYAPQLAGTQPNQNPELQGRQINHNDYQVTPSQWGTHQSSGADSNRRIDIQYDNVNDQHHYQQSHGHQYQVDSSTGEPVSSQVPYTRRANSRNEQQYRPQQVHRPQLLVDQQRPSNQGREGNFEQKYPQQQYPQQQYSQYQEPLPNSQYQHHQQQYSQYQEPLANSQYQQHHQQQYPQYQEQFPYRNQVQYPVNVSSNPSPHPQRQHDYPPTNPGQNVPPSTPIVLEDTTPKPNFLAPPMQFFEQSKQVGNVNAPIIGSNEYLPQPASKAEERQVTHHKKVSNGDKNNKQLLFNHKQEQMVQQLDEEKRLFYGYKLYFGVSICDKKIDLCHERLVLIARFILTVKKTENCFNYLAEVKTLLEEAKKNLTSELEEKEKRNEAFDNKPYIHLEVFLDNTILLFNSIEDEKNRKLKNDLIENAQIDKLATAIRSGNSVKCYVALSEIKLYIKNVATLRELTDFIEKVLSELHERRDWKVQSIQKLITSAIADIENIYKDKEWELKYKALMSLRHRCIKHLTSSIEGGEELKRSRGKIIFYKLLEIPKLDTSSKQAFRHIHDWLDSIEPVKELDSCLNQDDLSLLRLPRPYLELLIFRSTYKTLTKKKAVKNKPELEHEILNSLWSELPWSSGLGFEKIKSCDAIMKTKLNYANRSLGVPLRLFISDEDVFNTYFVNTVKYENPLETSHNELYKSVNEAAITTNEMTFDESEQCRPVTYVFQGAPIRLYGTNKNYLILMFSSTGTRPTHIFKKNAFTYRFIGQTIQEIERIANDRTPLKLERRTEKIPKRLTTITALGNKMHEYALRKNPLERNTLTDTHYSTKVQHWSQPKEARYVNQKIINHNEVVVKPILPNHVRGTVFYIELFSLTKGYTIYHFLGQRIRLHKDLEEKIKAHVPNEKLQFIIYCPDYASILEVDYLENMIPKCINNPLEIRGYAESLKYKCNNLGVSHHNVEKLLMRAPLKFQLTFLYKCHQEVDCDLNTLSRTLWDEVFHKPLSFSAINNKGISIGEILDYCYFQPRNLKNLNTCVVKGVQPVELENTIKPEEGAVTAICCEWLCDLLEMEGVCFSEPEKYLLLYTAMILPIFKDSPLFFDSWNNLFKKHFDNDLIGNFSRFLFDLDTPSEDKREAMMKFILHVSFKLPLFWVNKGPYKKYKKSITEKLEDIDLSREFMMPASLVGNYNFLNRFYEAIHGTIDLMQSLGMDLTDDNRSRKSFLQRFENLNKLNSDKKKNERRNYIRTSGNVWTKCKEQLQENAARQLCYFAGEKQTHANRLRLIKFPPSYQTIDLVLINFADEGYKVTISELIGIIKKYGLPKPTENISVIELQQVENNANRYEGYWETKKQNAIIDNFMLGIYSYSLTEKEQMDKNKSRMINQWLQAQNT